MSKTDYWAAKDKLSAALKRTEDHLAPNQPTDLYRQVTEQLDGLAAEINSLLSENEQRQV